MVELEVFPVFFARMVVTLTGGTSYFTGLGYDLLLPAL